MVKLNKLFDDTVYIDKSVVTPYDKAKWKAKFQSYCDSDEIRKESDENGLNACGYWYAVIIVKIVVCLVPVLTH